MKLRLTTPAARQLSRIAAYLTARSPIGARNVRAALRASFRTLQTFPTSGTACSAFGVRRLIEPRYGYRIYYQVEDGHILVLSLRHGAEDKDAVE